MVMILPPVTAPNVHAVWQAPQPAHFRRFISTPGVIASFGQAADAVHVSQFLQISNSSLEGKTV